MAGVDKMERLMNLALTLLDTTRPLSAEELGQRVGGYPDGEGAFRRAFERDKDDLRELGIPLTTEEIPGSDPPKPGYWIRRRDYYLEDPGFAPDEVAALQLATSLVRVDGAPAATGWWKLGGLEAAGEATDGAAPSELASLPGDPNVGRCFHAIGERRRLEFSYQGERRRVDPFRVEFGRGRWYLVGHDLSRGEERRFRLDRIDGSVEAASAGTSSAAPAPPASSADRPWQFGAGEAVAARVLIDGPQAGFAIREVGEDAVVERRPNGSVVVELAVTNRTAFRSFVLSFLDHAEVLAPPDLRDDVVQWLEAMA